MPKYLVRNFILFHFLIAAQFISFSQTETFKYYTVEEGLSQSQIHCAFQDSKGYLWFGTDAGGLCQFDGKTFTIYTTSDGLADNKVFSICEDSISGNLWVGTNKGISIFNGHYFIPIPEKLATLKNLTIGNILIDSKRETWIGTADGLYSWKENNLQKNSVISKLSVKTIFEDSQHCIWVGTYSKGLFKLSDSRIKNYQEPDGLISESIRSIIEPQPGVLWIGTDKGISQLNLSSETIKNRPDQKIPNITSILKDHNNKILVLTEGEGIFKLSENKWTTITTKQGLSTDILWCGVKDREGNLWLGTDGNGIIKYQLSPFSKITDQNGLFGNIILSILQDSKGDFWFGSEKGTTKITTDTITGKESFTYFLGENNKTPGERIWSTKEDLQGNIWFSTYKNGVYEYDGKSLKNYTEKDGLTNNYVRSILPDSKGNIWIGTAAGLNIYDPSAPLKAGSKKFKTYKKKDGLINGGIMSVFEDSKKNIWLATNGGIFKFNPEGTENNKFIGFTEKNGLPSNALLSIAEDNDGNIWCAGFKGISKVDIKNKTCKNINIDNGLSSNSVYILVSDKKGNMFVGTNKGIDKIDITEYNKTGKIKIKHFGKEEGFTGLECNSNASFTDKAGGIWFGSINGAIHYDPARDQLNTTEPLTHITDLSLFFKKFDWTKFSNKTDEKTNLPIDLKLPYNKNHITFNYVALSLTIPEKTLYSYKLEGFDQVWSPSAKQSFATYSYLPPGKYTFLIKAMNNDGVWTKNPASFSFTIDPPFWKTWWFLGLAFICTVIIIRIIFRVRLQSLKKNAEELQKRVDIKTMELRKEKETVEEQHKIIEKKNSNITASINYAKRIQTTVLPIKENIKKILPQSFILLKPRDIVSGDFYWFNQVENKIVLAAVDCTGHGIPGAFMSLIGNNLMNNVVNSLAITNPSQILYKLHEEIVITLKKSEQASGTVDGMDVSICVIDIQKGLLEFASTGQPLILIKNGKTEVIKSGKYPLGLILKKERTYETHVITLNKDDAFYMFTDGYIDQFGKDNDEKFSEARLKELLMSIQHLDMNEQEKAIDNSLNEWKGNLAQLDDILVIGVRI